MISSLMENGFWIHILRFLIGSSALLLVVWALEITRVIQNFELRAYLWKAALLGSLLLLLPVSLPQAPTFYIETANFAAKESFAEISPPSSQRRDNESNSAVVTSQQTTDSTNGYSVGSSNELLSGSTSTSVIGLMQKWLSNVLTFLSSIPMSYWMIAIWVTGGSLALIRLYLGNRRGILSLGNRRLVNDSDPVLKTFHKLCNEVGITNRPRLTRSERTCSPVTLPGMEICLPAWVDHSLPESELRSLLAHELGHIRNHDLQILFGLQLLTCFFFFQPLFKLAKYRLIDLSEFLADQVALSHSENSKAITTALVNCADRMNSDKPFNWGFAMIGKASRLKLRIQHLQNSRRITAERFSKPGRAIMLTTIFSIVLLTPSIQQESRAAGALLVVPKEIPIALDAELQSPRSDLEPAEFISPPAADIGLIGPTFEEVSELPEQRNEQLIAAMENSNQSIREEIKQDIGEIEEAQPEQDQQQTQDEQQPRQLQVQEQTSRQKPDQPLRLSAANTGKTYLLLNYSERGHLSADGIELTEPSSGEVFRIQDIQRLERGTENYILTEIEPGNYYVSGLHPMILKGSAVRRVDQLKDVRPKEEIKVWRTKTDNAVQNSELGPIQIVENSINYIGDIRVDFGIQYTGFSGLSVKELGFSPSASTLQNAASENPALFRSKNVVVSIATNDPVAIDKDLLNIPE